MNKKALWTLLGTLLLQGLSLCQDLVSMRTKSLIAQSLRRQIEWEIIWPQSVLSKPAPNRDLEFAAYYNQDAEVVNVCFSVLNVCVQYEWSDGQLGDGLKRELISSLRDLKDEVLDFSDISSIDENLSVWRSRISVRGTSELLREYAAFGRIKAQEVARAIEVRAVNDIREGALLRVGCSLVYDRRTFVVIETPYSTNVVFDMKWDVNRNGWTAASSLDTRIEFMDRPATWQSI